MSAEFAKSTLRGAETVAALGRKMKKTGDEISVACFFGERLEMHRHAGIADKRIIAEGYGFTG